MMDSMFEDGGVEAVALCFAMFIAVPSIIMMCFVLEEAPLKMERSLDDVPVFVFWSATEMFGQGWGTLICLFFVCFMLFGFAIAATSWYTVWRGSVAWNADSTSLSDMMTGGSAALLQAGHHAVHNSTAHYGTKLWEASSALATAAASGPALVALATTFSDAASKKLRASSKKKVAKKSLQPEK